MTFFFTADPHFLHANINRLAGRPFASVEEATEAMVERWCERVTDRDDVIVLGDACMGPIRESIEVVRALPGNKHLVPGNHDRVSALYRGSPAKKAEWRDLYGGVFHVLPEHVERFPIGADLSVDLCHFPYEGDSHGEDRYVEARPKDEGRWLVHGHVHEAWKVRGRQVNVGVDVWDYAPVSETELVEVIRANS